MPEPSTVFLVSGQMVVTNQPLRVKTVLGSCVAICMFARKLGWAAMVHCFLPRAGVPLTSLSRKEALNYVDTALEVMRLELASRGVCTADLEVKLFGGAESEVLRAGSTYQVGRRNVEAADESLAGMGFAPVSRSTGGDRGRLIELDCKTGEVLLRKLPGAQPHTRAGVE